MLSVVVITNPQLKISRSIISTPRRNRVSAHQVREVRAESPVGHCARDRVAVDAGGRLEYPLSLRNSLTYRRRLALLLNPLVKFIPRLDIHAQQHLGVLGPAILRTLAEVNADLLRVDPHRVGMVGNQISLTRQPWNPEAVVRIGR